MSRQTLKIQAPSRRAVRLGLLAALALGVTAAALPARAQDCTRVPEAIIRLRPHTLGNYSVWDTVYGAQGMEQFRTLHALPEGGVIAGGVHFPKDDDAQRRGLLTRIDHLGKVVWENRHDKAPPMTIDFVLVDPASGSIVTLGNTGDDETGGAVRLGLYGADGTLSREKIISDPRLFLKLADMVPAIEGGGGMALALEARDRKNPADEFGIVMRISARGGEVWRRSYRPGIANVFSGITVVRDSVGMPYYMISGNMDDGRKRRGGLLMKLEPSGDLVWARQYPRGTAATIRKVSNIGAGHFAAIGDIEPYGDLYERSSWIMRVDTGSGDMLWQRYISLSGYRLFGRDIQGYPDGRVNALLGAVLPEPEPAPEGATDEHTQEKEPAAAEPEQGEDSMERNQARLVTLSPRGAIMRDEPFTAGRGGRPHTLILNEQEQRIIAGFVERSHKADDEKNTANYDTHDGWALIAPALDDYTDPCIPRPVPVE